MTYLIRWHVDIYPPGSQILHGITGEVSGIGLYVSRIGSLLTAFCTGDEVVDYESAQKSDTALFARFFWQLLNEGVYWPPSQFEAAFISLATVMRR